MPPSLSPPDLFKHCLEACRLRRYMRTSAESLRELRLPVPETCWQAPWEALKSGPPVCSELLIAGRLRIGIPVTTRSRVAIRGVVCYRRSWRGSC